MTTTTEYGTWNNHGDASNRTVEASIADAVSGADSDWREEMQASGSFDRIAEAYRDAINEALPDGVSLAGSNFYGPYRTEDQDFEGYPSDELGGLDIRAIIEEVDLWAIIERYDVPVAVENAVKATKRAELLAQSSALARAAAVAAVVEACGGNQSEAARRLGLDQSTVNKLNRKAMEARIGAVTEAIKGLGHSAADTSRALKEVTRVLGEERTVGD